MMARPIDAETIANQAIPLRRERFDAVPFFWSFVRDGRRLAVATVSRDRPNLQAELELERDVAR